MTPARVPVRAANGYAEGRENHFNRESVMSISSVTSSYSNAIYDNVVAPVKNAVAKVGDEISDTVDTAVDAVKSAAHTVADEVSDGFKAIGSIIDTSA